jgi:carbon storage regulator
MLVLSRKMGEAIVIDGGIRITVVGIRGKQVRLGFEAPAMVDIIREELRTGTRNATEGMRSIPATEKKC